MTKDASSRKLDGLTLFRFAHIWRNASSGGVEAYLRDLNRNLLERNRMRILQMYLAPGKEGEGIEIERIGQGELVWIPSLFKGGQRQEMTRAQRFYRRLRKLRNQQSFIYHDLLLSTLNRNELNLAVFHHISEDSRTVINYLNKRQIPFVVVNHFQNARLKYRYIRSQISGALAIGGVSNVDVPRFVTSRFTNLSDGVDTDFFHLGKAGPLGRKVTQPIILLPARVTIEKGHLDAVKVLCLLSREGFSAALVFAGRYQESPVFMERLKRVISEEGVQERVIFTSEICPDDMRNWYTAASIVLLPSYAEGLPKVLLEAQAMGRPVVAYEVGGAAEAIRNGEGGFLVRKGDIEGLASRVKELLANEGKRREMGHQGRLFVLSQFSMETMVSRHEEFYIHALVTK